MGVKEEQWYSNKDLFEKLQVVMESVQDLKLELQQTRVDVRQYNNLRGQIADLQEIAKQWVEHIALHGGRRSAADGIRTWSGWIIAVILFLITIKDLFLK